MASQGLPTVLAVAITPSGPAQDQHGIRALIRRMSRANPLWGAPRIHGKLLKLGIKVSQATDCLTARIYSSFPERCGHRLALGDGRGRCL
jgi:hypothetical protein